MNDIEQHSIDTESVYLSENECNDGLGLLSFCLKIINSDHTKQSMTPIENNGISRWFARVTPHHHNHGVHILNNSLSSSFHTKKIHLLVSNDQTVVVSLKKNDGYWSCEVTHSSNTDFILDTFNFYKETNQSVSSKNKSVNQY